MLQRYNNYKVTPHCGENISEIEQNLFTLSFKEIIFVLGFENVLINKLKNFILNSNNYDFRKDFDPNMAH